MADKRKHTEETKKHAFKLYLQGEKVKNICRDSKISPPTLRKWLREAGIYKVPVIAAFTMPKIVIQKCKCPYCGAEFTEKFTEENIYTGPAELRPRFCPIDRENLSKIELVEHEISPEIYKKSIGA